MSSLAEMREVALTKTKRQLRFFYKDRLQPAAAFWRLNARDAEIFEALAGLRGRTHEPRASDYKVRFQSTQILLGLMLRHWREAQTILPGRRYFFITLIDNLGRTLDAEPQVNIDALQRKIYKALRDGVRTPDAIELHAVYALEVQAFNNWPEHGHGKMLSFHAHAVAWTDDASFNPAAWAATINASRSWRAEFGLPPADIQELNSELSLTRAVRYLSKVPADCKRRVTHGTAEKLRQQQPESTPRPWPISDGWQLVETRVGYRPAMVLRLFEGLSQIEMAEIVRGVGDGAEVRSAWRRRLVAWHRARSHGGRVLKMDSAAIARWWERQRRLHGSQRLRPWTFLHGGAKPCWPHSHADN